MGNDQQPLVEVKNLKKWFPVSHGFLGRITGYVKAVDDVNLYVKPGETLGRGGRKRLR